MPKHSRLIVISGVSRGLGEAMLAGFAAEGHTVWGCSRSVESVEQLRQKYPAPHNFHVVDVRRESQVHAWSQALAHAKLTPDLLINNAAVINPNQLLWETSASEFEDVIDTNIKGVFYMNRHFVPAMVARRQGVIVNFSSGWGRSTSPEVAPYCASKFAVEGLTQSLAQELPEGMAAVALNPGIIDTLMLRSCFGGDAAAYPPPARWAKIAVPYILSLNSQDNGRSATVPGN